MKRRFDVYQYLSSPDFYPCFTAVHLSAAIRSKTFLKNDAIACSSAYNCIISQGASDIISISGSDETTGT